MQAQMAESDLAEMAIGAHLQAQAEQRAGALDRILQRLQCQRQHLGGVGGAKAATDALHRIGFHRRIARHRQRRAGSFQSIELQHAEGRQRAHVVRPQQMHQRVGQLRQLVIELLPQPPGEKSETFEQTLDIRVAPGLPEERRQCRTALGEALA